MEEHSILKVAHRYVPVPGPSFCWLSEWLYLYKGLDFSIQLETKFIYLYCLIIPKKNFGRIVDGE
jgi:hypothetical protein